MCILFGHFYTKIIKGTKIIFIIHNYYIVVIWGWGVIWAMPERKRIFLGRCSLNTTWRYNFAHRVSSVKSGKGIGTPCYATIPWSTHKYLIQGPEEKKKHLPIRTICGSPTWRNKTTRATFILNTYLSWRDHLHTESKHCVRQKVALIGLSVEGWHITLFANKGSD